MGAHSGDGLHQARMRKLRGAFETKIVYDFVLTIVF